jgi:hypothetical protein
MTIEKPIQIITLFQGIGMIIENLKFFEELN